MSSNVGPLVGVVLDLRATHRRQDKTSEARRARTRAGVYVVVRVQACTYSRTRT